jgi:hypothetical protein
MNGESYILYFGSLRVGIVTQTDCDFPNLWGEIEYDPALAEPETFELARLSRFIALNCESTRLLDLEDEEDTDLEQQAISGELDTHYSEFVEAVHWHLIDSQGHDLPILCPILRNAGEIVWRWNRTDN